MNTRAQTTIIIVATLLIGVVIGALGSAALRQDRTRRFVQMPPRDRFHEAMERIIDPTPEQKQIIEGILERQARQVSALHDNFQQQMFALFDSVQIELNSVLTEEQKTRLREEMLRGPRRFMRHRVDELKEELNLTDEQVRQVEEVMTSFEPMPMQPPLDQDRPGMRRDLRRRFMRDRFMEVEEKLAEILTPEQMEKYRRMSRGRRFFMRLPGEEPQAPPFDFGRPEGENK